MCIHQPYYNPCKDMKQLPTDSISKFLKTNQQERSNRDSPPLVLDSVLAYSCSENVCACQTYENPNHHSQALEDNSSICNCNGA